MTSWTVAHQAPLSMGFAMSMGFPRQEYWSGLSFPPPGDLPNPGTEPMSPALQADSLPLSLLGSPVYVYTFLYLRARVMSGKKQCYMESHSFTGWKMNGHSELISPPTIQEILLNFLLER